MKTILYDLGGLNTQIFYAVNHIQGGKWYEKFMLLGATLGDYHYYPFYFLLVAIVAFIHSSRQPEARRKDYLWRWGSVLAVLCISYVADGLMLLALKNITAFPRPFKILPEGSVHLIGPLMDISKHHQSFPSAHASFSMLIAVGLWPMLNAIGKAGFVFFALWIGVSRLAMGVHFPVDVIVGYMLGLIVVLLVRWGWNHIALPIIKKRFA